MKRCAISVLTAAILMAWEPGVMPLTTFAPLKAQEEQTQSSLADPVDRDRIFCGWETLLLLFESDPQTGHNRRGTFGRTFFYTALGLAVYALFRLLMGRHKALLQKACRIPHRTRLIPLGSHAPPAIAM